MERGCQEQNPTAFPSSRSQTRQSLPVALHHPPPGPSHSRGLSSGTGSEGPPAPGEAAARPSWALQPEVGQKRLHYHRECRKRGLSSFYFDRQLRCPLREGEGRGSSARALLSSASSSAGYRLSPGRARSGPRAPSGLPARRPAPAAPASAKPHPPRRRATAWAWGPPAAPRPHGSPEAPWTLSPGGCRYRAGTRTAAAGGQPVPRRRRCRQPPSADMAAARGVPAVKMAACCQSRPGVPPAPAAAGARAPLLQGRRERPGPGLPGSGCCCMVPFSASFTAHSQAGGDRVLRQHPPAEGLGRAVDSDTA